MGEVFFQSGVLPFLPLAGLLTGSVRKAKREFQKWGKDSRYESPPSPASKRGLNFAHKKRAERVHGGVQLLLLWWWRADLLESLVIIKDQTIT